MSPCHVQMWPGATHWPDFMNPKTVSWWQSQIQVPSSRPLPCLSQLKSSFSTLSCFCTCPDSGALLKTFLVSLSAQKALSQPYHASALVPMARHVRCEPARVPEWLLELHHTAGETYQTQDRAQKLLAHMTINPLYSQPGQIHIRTSIQ